MRLFTSVLCLMVALHCSFAPPVNPDKTYDESDVKDNLDEYMEYSRYLKEVVQALESDPDFRERLEKADVDDVRSGKIADQLDFVNHNVRSKLDEIKRRELERLRHLATKQYELTNNLDADMGKVSTNEHLDHANPHTFEIEDLKKLIMKTTADLEAADKQRKEEFKEYEMQKEFDKHQVMENMDEPQKKEYEEKLKKEEDAKKHHAPLHHPGTRKQLLEIWKSADQLDSKDFDPKVFFMMHDVDGNGAWDADEVKALFIKELDKLYGPGGPNKDLHERAEEMERMREHVFKENDKNRDGLIDFHEFMMETQKSDFNQDDGWKPIDENQIYTQAEYQEYERRRLEELRYLQQRGLVDAHGRPLNPGSGHQIHQAQQEFHRNYQQQYHQQGYPQQHYPQGHPGQGYQQAGPMPPQGYQQHPGQAQQYPPQPQGHPQGQQQYQPPQGQQQYQPPQGQPQPPQQYQAPQGQPQKQPYQPPQGQPQQQQYQPPQGQPQQQQYQPPQGQPQQQQYQPPQGQPQQQQYQPPQGQPQGQQQHQPSQGQPAQTFQQNLNQQAGQGLSPPSQGQTKEQQQLSQGQAPPPQLPPNVQPAQPVQGQAQTQQQAPGQAPVPSNVGSN